MTNPILHWIACEIFALVNSQAYQKKLAAMLRAPR
jgi:hypothetical protein